MRANAGVGLRILSFHIIPVRPNARTNDDKISRELATCLRAVVQGSPTRKLCKLPNTGCRHKGRMLRITDSRNNQGNASGGTRLAHNMVMRIEVRCSPPKGLSSRWPRRLQVFSHGTFCFAQHNVHGSGRNSSQICSAVIAREVEPRVVTRPGQGSVRRFRTLDARPLGGQGFERGPLILQSPRTARGAQMQYSASRPGKSARGDLQTRLTRPNGPG
jgi:hypothetical protein